MQNPEMQTQACGLTKKCADSLTSNLPADSHKVIIRVVSMVDLNIRKLVTKLQVTSGYV